MRVLEGESMGCERPDVPDSLRLGSGPTSSGPQRLSHLGTMGTYQGQLACPSCYKLQIARWSLRAHARCCLVIGWFGCRCLHVLWIFVLWSRRPENRQEDLLETGSIVHNSGGRGRCRIGRRSDRCEECVRRRSQRLHVSAALPDGS